MQSFLQPVSHQSELTGWTPKLEATKDANGHEVKTITFGSGPAAWLKPVKAMFELAETKAGNELKPNI